jgi:hypothetical protein
MAKGDGGFAGKLTAKTLLLNIKKSFSRVVIMLLLVYMFLPMPYSYSNIVCVWVDGQQSCDNIGLNSYFYGASVIFEKFVQNWGDWNYDYFYAHHIDNNYLLLWLLSILAVSLILLWFTGDE